MKKLVRLLALLLLLSACGGDLPLPQDAYEPHTSTPNPATVEAQMAGATPTPVRGEAEGFARAFYRAWEQFDYAGMYSLLTAQSQAVVGFEAFQERYREAMETATVQTIRAQPLSALQEENQARFSVRVVWETAVVGSIIRDHTMQLTFQPDQNRWGIEWDESLILPELTGGNHLAMNYRIPARANIYDVNGKALAYQGNVIQLGIVPGQIEDEDGLLEALAPVLDRSKEEIAELYASAQPDWYVPVGDIPETTMQEFALDLQPYIDKGLAPPRTRLARIYPQNGVAPHIAGYTSLIPAEELETYKAEGYRGDEMVGRAGLEAWGEDYLNGDQGGTLTVVGANGEYVTTVQEKEPTQARSIYTAIERDFQAAVEQILAQAIQSFPTPTAGSIVVLDVNTGAVLAMASYPSYDPAVFDRVRSDADATLAQVLNDPGRPLLNRVIQGAYPAGSIFKVVTMSAGLNSGLYTPQTRYTSTGSWNKLGENFIKYDWREGGHGTVSLTGALVVSCNTCFYDVGYNVNNADPMLLAQTARAFGLGQPTGIQLNEAAGTIPDPEWKINNVGEGWVPGDAVNMAIGQGFVQVTPLQIANIFAAVANGGTLYRPSVVDRIGEGGGAPEEKWPVQENGRLPLSPEHLTAIREGLWQVANNTNSGTAAYQFVGLPAPVAGKTGTAEAPPRAPHAWFGGYAPAAPYTNADGTVVNQPEIAVVVMVENAGEGSAVAAPIFRQIIELYYGITPRTPLPWQ